MKDAFEKLPKVQRAIFWARQIEMVEGAVRQYAVQVELHEIEARAYKAERDNEANPPHIRAMASRALRHVRPELLTAAQIAKECCQNVARARRALHQLQMEADL
jgi:hypothetical protein